MGTITMLHDALKARMKAVAAKFPLLETETAKDGTAGAPRAPVVFDSDLPPKRASAGDTASADQQAMAGKQFPFLIVRPASGGDTEQSADQNATAVFKVVIGTWSDTDDGVRDVALIIDAIRVDLDEYPAIDGTAFECVSSSWEIPEQQARPQWFGIVTTNWIVPRPRRVEVRTPMEG